MALPLSGALGCLAPEIAIVSRQTALERQAAGEYPEREAELEQAALRPGPAVLPREELGAAGAETEAMLPTYAAAPTDEELLTSLLVAGCVGEGSDGLLVPIERPCEDDIGADALANITRENTLRRQAWDYLAGESGRPLPDVREAWRAVHLERLVCGAWAEDAAGRWEQKSCE